MRFLRRLKLEELEQRVVPVVLLAGVPGQDTFTFTDADGDLVQVKIGNLFNPLGSSGGTATILNSDGNDPGTAGNADIATIVFNGATTNQTGLDIDIIGGTGNGSVEAGDITAPARLQMIRVTGNIGTAIVYGFDTNAVTANQFGGIVTRGISGNVDRIIVTGGDLGVASQADNTYPEVKIDVAGRLGELVVSGDIGDGLGFVVISAQGDIGDISAASFITGRIYTPGNLHGLTLSGAYSAGGTALDPDGSGPIKAILGGLDIGSLGDSATGSGGIFCQKIEGIASLSVDVPGTVIKIAGDCYANITALEKISGSAVVAGAAVTTNARVSIVIGGNVGPLATISSGGDFANFVNDAADSDADGNLTEIMVDIANPPLKITGDLEGRVAASLHGNTAFDPQYFVFGLGIDTPTFMLRGGTATTMNIVAGGNMIDGKLTPNTASIEVIGSALEVRVEDINVYSFSNTQQIRDITFERDIVGPAVISKGIASNGSFNVRDIASSGSLTIYDGVHGTATIANSYGSLAVVGNSDGIIDIDNYSAFLTIYGNLAGSSATHPMRLSAADFGVIDISGNVGDFTRISATGDIALLHVSGSFASSYYDTALADDVFTLGADGNVKFAKIDGPISGEVVAYLKDVPNIVTVVNASHTVRQTYSESHPGALQITDDSGDTQYLRISGGTARVNLLPTANGNVIMRIEVTSGNPSIELFGAEVGHIVSNKSLGNIYLDPVLYRRQADGGEFPLGTLGSTVYTIESRTGGIGSIYSGGGDIVCVRAAKSVGKIVAGLPKALKIMGLYKIPSGFDLESRLVTGCDVGVLETALGGIVIRDLTGVYVGGNIGHTYASGNIANYEITGNAGDIRAFFENRQVTSDSTVPWQAIAGGKLRGFFDIGGKARDIGARTGIDVDYISVGGNIRDIESRSGGIKSEHGITAASSIRNVEAGFRDVLGNFVPNGNVEADITSVNGNIARIRGTNLIGDFSANKNIGEISADFNIGRRFADGVYQGSIFARSIGKIYADNDIFADVTAEKNVSKIIANADGDLSGGIYGDIDIGGNAGRIEAYENIAGNIDVAGKCGRLVSGNGSFTGNINIGKLSRWELKSDFSIVNISGTVNIDELTRLKAPNAVISGDITLGRLGNEFDTLEAHPVIISGTAPFEFLFAMGNPDGTLTILTGDGKTIDRIK